MQNKCSHDACGICMEHRATGIKNSYQSILYLPCQLVEVKNVATARVYLATWDKIDANPLCIN